MDDVVNRFAKELADAIAAAVAENPQVEACRARAREAGYDMRVTLEAVVGFVNRNNGAAVTKITTPARLLPARKTFELTTNDRRFRAFDASTGRKLWETELEAGAHSTPISYVGADGKQYVVVAAGGGTSAGGPEMSDTMVAYALP